MARIFRTALLFVLFGPLSVHAQSTFVVPPSGGDDTAAIQSAFDDAVAAGPGSAVVLQAGTYCVTSPIIVRGFDGYWMGAARDQTIVETCASPFPVPTLVQADPAYPGDPLFPVRGAFTFIEVDGKPSTDLTIVDLALHIKGETDPFYRFGDTSRSFDAFQHALQIVGARPTVFDGVISKAALSVDRVGFVGSDDGAIGAEYGSNLLEAIVIQGGAEHISFFPGDFSYKKREQIQVALSVTRSHFERLLEAVDPLEAVDSSITVGGNDSVGNTFETILGSALYTSPSNSIIRFMGNSGSLAGGVIIVSGNQALFGIDDGPQPGIPFPPEPSQVMVSGNDLDLSTSNVYADYPSYGAYGAVILDFPLTFAVPGVKSLNVLIENNLLLGVNAGFLPGIVGVELISSEDAIVRNNVITGRFLGPGIAAGFSLPAHNLDFLGNNLTGTETNFVAPIFLGSLSSDCLIVGGPNGRGVLDQGVDNVITGVNTMTGNPPGPELQELAEQFATFGHPGHWDQSLP